MPTDLDTNPEHAIGLCRTAHARLEEVEMHHLDLGLGYQPADWPDDYVAWALPRLLATVPSRLRRDEDARAFVAWLSGREPVPAAVQLEPW